jgi:hypothetical protein
VAFLKDTVIAAGPFDVIIDDSGHSDNQMLMSLFELLYGGALRPGGLYFVEDLICNFENVGGYRDNRCLLDYFSIVCFVPPTLSKASFIICNLKSARV